MRQINVRVIPHSKQRYETVGDWWFEGQCLEIRVSDMGNEHYNFLVARHEIDEAVLCEARGIKEKDVSDFDVAYEKLRAQGDPNYQGEPGDAWNAPYKKEHFFATTQERAMAAELKVDWETYDDAVNAL